MENSIKTLENQVDIEQKIIFELEKLQKARENYIYVTPNSVARRGILCRLITEEKKIDKTYDDYIVLKACIDDYIEDLLKNKIGKCQVTTKYMYESNLVIEVRVIKDGIYYYFRFLRDENEFVLLNNSCINEEMGYLLLNYLNNIFNVFDQDIFNKNYYNRTLLQFKNSFIKLDVNQGGINISQNTTDIKLDHIILKIINDKFDQVKKDIFHNTYLDSEALTDYYPHVPKIKSLGTIKKGYISCQK